MGGQALSVATRRYQKKEFEQLEKEVTEKLQPHFKKVHPLIAFKEKESFGDMDVLVSEMTTTQPFQEFLHEKFSPNEISRNGSVYSFDYKELQIDLIKVSPRNWETTKTYYSYNDLGNLMGRIASRIGLKYGHYGLGFKHTHKGEGLGDIVISQDLPKIFEFLGFDYERYLQGFDTLEDIFKFVTESKYFIKEIFDYENLNHQNKTRNRKRANYRNFLEYIQNNDVRSNPNYKHVRKGTNLTEKEYHVLQSCDAYFDSNVIEQIEYFNKRVELRAEARKKFNGDILMNLYNIEGKELGEMIKSFKDTFPTEEAYYNFLYSNSEDIIFKRFDNVLKFKQNKNIKYVD